MKKEYILLYIYLLFANVFVKVNADNFLIGCGKADMTGLISEGLMVS